MVTSRIRFTAKQKGELWERWKKGQSMLTISRALESRNKTGVQRIVALHGGIAPAPRRRAVTALRLEEGDEISPGIAAGRSIRRIARGLGRWPSTMCRQIRRNGGSQAYRANRADRRAWERALRPKPCRLALSRELRWRVAAVANLINDLHDVFWQALWLAAMLHILAVALYCVAKRQNLLLPMITGCKLLPQAVRQPT